MTAYVEYELRCDGTPDMGPFDCTIAPIFAKTAAAAREQAAHNGWITGPRSGVTVDLCPDHKQGYRRWMRKRGICTGCDQERALTACGDVVAKHSHPDQPKGQRWAAWCSGSHQPPRASVSVGGPGNGQEQP